MTWDEEIDALVGKSLRVLRANAELTQGDLAERLSEHGVPMSQQTIAKIESGSRSLRLSEAAAIVQALDDGQGHVRMEHLIAAPDDLVLEMEAQRTVDNISAAIGRLSTAAKDLTLWTLSGSSFLEENPGATGVASRTLEAFTKNGAAGLLNVVRSGVREALEEGQYADEPTYNDMPEHARPFLDVVEQGRAPDA